MPEKQTKCINCGTLDFLPLQQPLRKIVEHHGLLYWTCYECGSDNEVFVVPREFLGGKSV
jgi:RNase P subunit RPR2